MVEAVLDISDILGFLLKQTHLTEAELARQVSVPRATINRLVSGRTPDPRVSTLEAIAKYFNITLDQLLGRQPILQNDQSIITGLQTSIPILEWEKAKNWQKNTRDLKPNNYFDWVMIDPSAEEGKFALRVKGDAMWPQFQENSILVIDPNKEWKNRDYVVAYIQQTDDVIFRQILMEGKYKFLNPINNLFPKLELQNQDKIIGVLIQIRRNF